MSRQYNNPNPFLPGVGGGDGGDLSGNLSIMGYGLTNYAGPTGGMLSLTNVIENARRMQNVQENLFSSIVLNYNPLHPINQDISGEQLRNLMSPILPGVDAQMPAPLSIFSSFRNELQGGERDGDEDNDRSDDDRSDDGRDDYTENLVRRIQEMTFNSGLGIAKKRRVKEGFLDTLKERGWRGEVEGEPEKCSVCFEQGKQAVDLPCGHGFHRDCIEPWFKEHATCPICRREFEQEEQEDDTAGSASGGGVAGVAPPVPPQNPRIEYAETIANALRNIQFGPQLLGIRELMTSALGGGASAAANEREALMRREQMEIEAAIMESLRDIETADYGQQSHHASGDDDESDHGQFSDQEDVD